MSDETTIVGAECSGSSDDAAHCEGKSDEGTAMPAPASCGGSEGDAEKKDEAGASCGGDAEPEAM